MRKIPVNRAVNAANLVLEECGCDSPLDLTLEQIVLGRGVTALQSIPITGSQGRIIFNGVDAIISYSDSILNEGKKRFVIAHELGHFELHKNKIERIHNDDEKSLNEWYAKGIHEQEANNFASELLMPSLLYIPMVTKKKFNLKIIKELADFFKVSITAALLKYRLLGDFPIAIIFSENKKIEWTAFSIDFPLQFIKKGSVIPLNSVANDFFCGMKLPDEPEEIDPDEWFSEDYKLKYYLETRFYEQCIQVGNKGVLSCIWND